MTYAPAVHALDGGPCCSRTNERDVPLAGCRGASDRRRSVPRGPRESSLRTLARVTLLICTDPLNHSLGPAVAVAGGIDRTPVGRAHCQ